MEWSGLVRSTWAGGVWYLPAYSVSTEYVGMEWLDGALVVRGRQGPHGAPSRAYVHTDTPYGSCTCQIVNIHELFSVLVDV